MKMKRSEIVLGLQKHLSDNIHIDIRYDVLENILDYLEEHSMRPTESELFGGHYEIRRVTNWEPEDGLN